MEIFRRNVTYFYVNNNLDLFIFIYLFAYCYINK